jgi:hypothetical protein
MSENNDTWAIVELMGHVMIAGRVSKPGEFGGLWKIDIPEGDSFRTEFFGSQSVYRVRIVSEKIARAYARPGDEVIAFDGAIISREDHEMIVNRLQEKVADLAFENQELTRRNLLLADGKDLEE